MMRFAPSRDFYVPAGAVKIADKASDAVVFIYTSHKDTLASLKKRSQTIDYRCSRRLNKAVLIPRGPVRDDENRWWPV